jgi:hypothetical protein
MIRIIVVLVLFFLSLLFWFTFLFVPLPYYLSFFLSLPLSCFIFFLLRPFPNRRSYPGIRSIIQIFCLSLPVQGGYKKDLLSYDVNPPLLASVCDTAWSIYSAFPAFFPLFSYRLSPLLFVCPVSASHSSSPCLSCSPPLSSHSKAVDHPEELH